MSIQRRAAVAFMGAALSLLAACGGDPSAIAPAAGGGGAGAGAGGAGGGGVVPVATLVSIKVTPATASIDAVDKQQFAAVGTYSDGKTADLTATATWSAADTTKATISSAGLASAVDAGLSAITASSAGVTSSTAALTVTPTVWKVTGALGAPRAGHKAVLLPSGKVLVAGGAGAQPAELYDPAKATWSATGQMVEVRTHLQLVLLQNGKVLAFGGLKDMNGTTLVLATSELYDPVTGLWTATGSMGSARVWATSAVLNDGKVLVSGNDSPATAELYDPQTGTWSPTGAPKVARAFAAATRLQDGKVLVVGGVGEGGSRSVTAELYDPTTKVWTLTTGSMGESRQQHTATLLPNGKVLVVGGRTGGGPYWTVGSELFDPVTQLWTQGDSLATSRSVHTATLMPNGSVAVVAGENGLPDGSSPTQISKSETFGAAAGAPVNKAMNQARVFHTTTLLPNGRLLAVGGYGSAAAPTTAELL